MQKRIPFQTFFNIVILLCTFSLSAGQTVEDSILKEFKWRNIGPANVGGRVADVEGVESNPNIVYVGAASGGVWKTVNAGVTWDPVFDDQPVGSIGDLAVSTKDPDIVYVGTGEANGRNSSPWGAGVFKTIDGGKNWEFLGLKETHHIGRIIIDSQNPDIAYVAAVGHLWGPNEERGLYKTTDGGKNWDKILYIDENTGATDVAMDPVNNNILYAAMYERQRDAFSGGNPSKRFGPGSGIYVSSDAGESWTKATGGLPAQEMGRIGLAVARTKPGTLYAIIETQLSERRIREGMSEEERSSAEEYNKQNANEFSGIYKSTGYGISWERVGAYNSRPFYFSQLRVDPNDENILWAGGGLMYSEDGGKTFEDRRGSAMVDFHALWIDPNDSDHILAGCDGGINISYDRGTYLDHNNQMSTVQFYAITADMQKPYYVYGGLQDNDCWAGPSRTRSRWGIRNRDWFSVGGGDGLQVQVDQTDHKIVYSESQNGGIRRIDFSTGQSTSIRPDSRNAVNFEEYYPDYQSEAPEGQQQQRGRSRSPFRFDWNSPIMLSSYNSRTVYFGGNHLFKSLDRGDHWSIISPDLTSTPDKPSAVVSIDESPLNPNVLWAGTNDGNVWLTRSGGVNWTKLNNYIPNAPQKYWVKRIEASNHIEGRAYLVFDGHRNDDQNPYIYVTEDFGQTWSKISSNLPEGSVYVVREDYKNPDLLFAGTEFAVYISLDRGKSWNRFMNNFPAVPVHDLYIHPRDGDLIAGTHGRGVWIADNITALQQLNDEILDRDSHLFDVRPEIQWASVIEWAFSSDKDFRAPNPPAGSTIYYYIKSTPVEAVLEVSDITGTQRFTTQLMDEAVIPGIHAFLWNFRFNPPPMNEQQRRQFESQIQTAIQQEESDELRQQMQQLLERFQQAQTETERIVTQRRLQQLTGGDRRRATGGGASAEPGEYLVTLTVDGEVMKTTLIIEKDNPGYMGR